MNYQFNDLNTHFNFWQIYNGKVKITILFLQHLHAIERFINSCVIAVIITKAAEHAIKYSGTGPLPLICLRNNFRKFLCLTMHPYLLIPFIEFESYVARNIIFTFLGLLKCY